MNPVSVIAGKEIGDGFRNRWVLAAALLLGALALAMAFVGSAPTGAVGASRLSVTVVSLSSLGVFLIPLIGLLLSYEALVTEGERGTVLLLLACPVARWHVVLGKFLGHAAILVFAVVTGYGAAALAAGLSGGADAEDWLAFGAMAGSSALLGAVFIALGYLIGAAVRSRGAAAGIAVAVWLVFVVLYDAALLGVLVADKGHVVTEELFHALMALNPTGLYRMFNLSGSEGVASAAGMAGLAANAGFSAPLLLGALAAWVVVPLTAAVLLLRAREP